MQTSRVNYRKWTANLSFIIRMNELPLVELWLNNKRKWNVHVTLIIIFQCDKLFANLFTRCLCFYLHFIPEYKAKRFLVSIKANSWKKFSKCKLIWEFFTVYSSTHGFIYTGQFIIIYLGGKIVLGKLLHLRIWPWMIISK